VVEIDNQPTSYRLYLMDLACHYDREKQFSK
jgi:hypothetical protein